MLGSTQSVFKDTLFEVFLLARIDQDCGDFGNPAATYSPIRPSIYPNNSSYVLAYVTLFYLNNPTNPLYYSPL